MSGRRQLLVALSVIGFVAPNVMLGVFIGEHGVDISRYFGNWVATLPSSQLVVDLGITLIAFLGWTAWDGPRSGVKRWWVAIPATALVGVCFAVPLYLYLRETAVEAGR